MTSRNSFSEGKLLREGMRRSLWSIVLSGLGFFFTMTLPVLMMTQRLLEEMNQMQEPRNEYWLASIGNIGLVLTGENPIYKLVFVAMAVVCGVSGFAYLHSRQKVDFYHSLPVSRTRLFWTNFANGFLCTVPLYLVMLGLSILFLYGVGFHEAVNWPEIGGAIICNLILFFLIYALSALTTILCGNTVIALLLLLWVQFSLAVVRLLQMNLFDIFFETYIMPGSDATMHSVLVLSPILEYLAKMDGLSYVTYNGHIKEVISCVWVLVIYLVLAVLATVLAWFLFRTRKSERAGTALAFEFAKLPIKVYMCLMSGTAMGMLFWALAGKVWFWIGLVIGTVLFHAVVEIIYAFDFRALFQNPVHMAGILAVLIVIMLGFEFDAVGYDKWVPSKGSVQSVSIGSESEPVLVSPENIAAVLRLAEIGIENNRKDNKRQEAAAYTVESDDIWSSCIVNYRLSSGRTARRYYYIPYNDETVGLNTQIMCSEEYKRAFWPLFDYENHWDEFGDNMAPRLDVYSLSDDRKFIWDREKIEEIVDTLKEESLQRSAVAVPVLDIGLRMSGKYDYADIGYVSWGSNYYEEIAHVTAEDKKTLALIKQYTGIEPVTLTVDTCGKIYVNEQEITDRTEQEALLKNAIVMSGIHGWGTHGSMEHTIGSEMIAEPAYEGQVHVIIGEQEYSLFYPWGEAPKTVIEKYCRTSR